MSFDIVTEILNVLSRAQYGFWLRDPLKREHGVSSKFLGVIIIFLVVLMALFGSGTNVIASTIYAVFFFAALLLSVLFVLVRTRDVSVGRVAVLIEAYVVGLFISLLVLSHNILAPIPFFSIRTQVDRGVLVQFALSFVYALPAATYLAIRSRQFVRFRVLLLGRSLRVPANLARMQSYGETLSHEIIGWSVFNYFVLSILLWIAVFARGGRLEILNEIIQGLKP